VLGVFVRVEPDPDPLQNILEDGVTYGRQAQARARSVTAQRHGDADVRMQTRAQRTQAQQTPAQRTQAQQTPAQQPPAQRTR
jgi:hypothetical protein